MGRRPAPPGRPLPVDLDELSALLEATSTDNPAGSVMKHASTSAQKSSNRGVSPEVVVNPTLVLELLVGLFWMEGDPPGAARRQGRP
jgi:hypothetical protein